MSRKYKKIIDDEYKQSRDYFRKAIEEQYQKDINKKTGTHSTLDDDIAPVKKERTWFSTGAFDDGYDFGDVTKSILGTIGDTGSNIMEGVASVGHNLAALTAGGVAEVADFIGQDDYANKVRNRLAGKDEETNEFLNKYSPKEKFSDASDFFGGSSLLGEKSDNLASSAGSLMGAMALQSVGVPGIATMGLQAAGGELENAYKSGATSKEAWTSAAVTGISEAVIERLSGGISFGAKTLDELWKEPLTKAITNRTANTFAKYGLDILGEGAEEVITEAVQSLGRLSYEDKSVREALFSEEARDNYIEAFIGGGIIGGGFSAKRAYDSVKTGRDYDTGLSANEQRVIDSEVKSRTTEKQKKAAVEAKVSQIINEREATLGTLTDAEKKNIRQNVQTQLENGQLDYSKAEIDKKELAAIEKQVREDLDRGDIGIDAIEGTLAGEKTAQINDLKAELSKTTNEAKKAEIQAKLNELTADRATQMQELLRKDVYLQESYRQEALKSQEFTREVTDKDSDITKELIESAKSVKMNDTRKMHDLFEYTNKIANDSGTKYGFVNNEQLKELGHAVEGTTINGLVRTNKDGSAKVLINVDSDKALNAIIGHETTHLLEGTGEYKTLQDIVKQYATTKGDYDVRLQSMKKLYEGVDANLENEITADLVGDYLFTDEQFIKELTADRNVFQKIYDYVKRAYKMATAGSKEKRELEKVKRSFEKAYKEISKTTTQQTKDNSATDADSNTAAKYSVTENMSEEERYQELKDKRLKVAEVKENEALDDQDWSSKSVDAIYDFIVENRENIGLKENYSHEDISFEFQFGNRRIKKSLNETLRTKQDLNDFKDLLSNFGEVIENAVLIEKHKEKNVDNKSSNLDAVYVFLSAYRKGNAITPVRLQVKELKGDGGRLYFAVTIEKSRVTVTTSPEQGAVTTSIDSDISIAELVKNINPEAVDTLKYLPDKMLSEEQKEGKKKGLAKDREKYGSKYSLSDNNIKVYSTGYSYGETFFRMQYVENGEELGWISYGVYEGEPNIKMMEVSPKHRRKGIGRKLLQALQKKYPDTEINFGMTTPDGTKLVESATYQVENEEVQAKLDRIKEIQAKLSEYDKVYEDFFNDKIPHPGEDYAEDYNDLEYEMSELQREVRGKSTTKTFVKYSLDPDTRFSLSAPVEETKDLLVLHNTSELKLLKQLKLEGFPMPSLAVTNQPHTNFGSISIIFDKDTIDPKKNKKNKTYSADAWTPTVPATEHEVDNEVDSNFKQTLKDFADNPYYSDEIQRLLYDTEDSLNRNYGYDGFIKSLAERPAIQYAFLKSKGETVEIAQKEKEVDLGFQTGERSISRYERLINGYPGDISELRKKPYNELFEVDIVKEMLSELPFNDRNRQSRFIDRVTREAMAYQQYDPNAPANVEYIDDYSATDREIAQRVDPAEVEDWLRSISQGIVKSEGIYNGKDYYTPSGNRRSFKQTHYPVTAENIVKAMQAQGEKSVTSFNGIKTLRATTAKTFKSIEEIRKSKGRMQALTEEEINKIHDELSDKMFEVFGKIIDENPKRFSKNDIFSRDHIGELFSEVGENVNASYIKGLFNKYGYEMSSETADESFKLLDAISAMPVYIFEAKPQRVVGYDEIKAVVIPEDSSEALKNALREKGIGFVEYDGTEADRQEKVNKAAEEESLKFSLSNNLAPTGSYNVYRSDVLLPEAQTAPEAPTVAENETVEDIAPVVIPEELRYEEGKPLSEADLPYVEQERDEAFYSITEDYAPEEEDGEFYSVPNTAALDDKSLRMLTKNMKDELNLKPRQTKSLEKIIQDFSTSEEATRETLYEMIEEEFGTVYVQNKINEVVQVKKDLRELRVKVSDTIKGDIPDYFQFKQRNFGKIRFSNQGLPVDDVYEGLKALYPGYFPADIYNPTDQLLKMVEVANLDAVYSEEYSLPEGQIQDVTDFIYESVLDYKREAAMKASHEAGRAPIDESMIPFEPKVKREIAPSNFDPNNFTVSRGVQQEYDAEAGEIVDDTHDIELERLERRKKKAMDDLGDLTSYTKQQAQALYDEVRMMQKGKKVSADLGFILDRMFDGVDKKADNYEEVKDATYKKITDALLAIERSPAKPEKNVPPTESLIRNSIETKYGWRVSEIEGMKLDSRAEARRKLRKELVGVNAEGLTKALDNAKNIPMALMNNTDTIRNTELVFGRENGKIINEAIFQKEIDNESKSIAWQNKERAEIKELGIKARSKESAAVQKYGEKQYVNEFGDLVKYGEDELIAEFPNVETQAKIRQAARIIREKYDEYIDLANETLTKLGFDPIKKRNDYMRHFQELNDVFSRYGIPFNAEALQEHDLPTDINGLTDSWSPQKNYFANMQPRKGQRTTLDAVTGIDGYIGGIANLIYHTEDIQRGRAFEEIIRETYGQEKGWENLEKMEELSPEEYQARADKIQDNHLSNYAAWVHEWTNNIAGKKSKVDRSIESMFGRKAFALLDQTRKQVGANMIGFNLSSSLTNLVAPVQAAAKTNKLALAKGTADTIKNIFVKDNFTEKNSFLTARMGTDMLSKTAWEKVQDAGYVFMKGMDWFSSNQIVRSKYYELRAKGMSEEQAHAEAGKFAARIMGDRTKGAQAQLYNSKLIGLVTQFQLEVNNQLYSMFYDTYHESKENAKNNAARTAAGMTFTLGQLAALTHVFGKTFEAIAGYNPTFDIIGIIATALGAGDDDDEKTTGERLKDAADKLVDALPYVNILTGGGRIPIASGIPNPIGVMTGGKDEYGNELTWGDEAKKLLYLIPPTGGNQGKKTYQGLSMFDEDLPVSGSYTGSGNLRYPVEDTPINRAQAALFGQYASGNARDYFDNERDPLKEKQIQEYADLDIPIADYWKYREGLKDQETIEDKFDYIAGLDLPVSKKNIMINNIVDREEEVDLTNYSDFGSYEEFDWAVKNPEKYDFLQANDVSYEEYNRNDVSRDAYNWAFKNQEGYTVSRAVSDVVTYRQIAGSLYDIKADKDSEGKSISGSRKEKVLDYINGLDLDYGARLILFKSEYPSYDDANMDIIDYLNNRDDISYEDMVTILTELEFTVDAEGNIYW